MEKNLSLATYIQGTMKAAAINLKKKKSFFCILLNHFNYC